MTITLHEGDLPADVMFTGAVAIDSETMGLKPRRDRLCLVQLSSGDGNAHLVRFKKGVYEAPRLKALLSDKNIVKIFHYARFDVAVLLHFLGVVTAPVYCTKIASKLARTYTDRHGLKDLTQELLGIELSKVQQSSDWGADDLTPEQLEYAASDVYHLHAMREKLDVMLAREGRSALAQASFDYVAARAALDLMGFDDMDVFAH